MAQRHRREARQRLMRHLIGEVLFFSRCRAPFLVRLFRIDRLFAACLLVFVFSVVIFIASGEDSLFRDGVSVCLFPSGWTTFSLVESWSSVLCLFGRGVWVQNVPWRVECGSTGTGLPLSRLVEGNVVYLDTCRICNVLQAKAITSLRFRGVLGE